MQTIRDIEDECLRMKDAVRLASSLAVGIASDPPGWKSFCISIRSRVVIIIVFFIAFRLQKKLDGERAESQCSRQWWKLLKHTVAVYPILSERPY